VLEPPVLEPPALPPELIPPVAPEPPRPEAPPVASLPLVPPQPQASATAATETPVVLANHTKPKVEFAIAPCVVRPPTDYQPPRRVRA
jgi:hypothetical protein